jgi:adenylate kinase family enzyme
MKPQNSLSQRIMIFGLPGSGKSTFSLRLSQLFGLPLYHLDRYYFCEKWVIRETTEFLTIQKNLVEQDTWIIDGNALQSLEMRYCRAHIVIFMAYPRLLCLWRIFKRLWQKDPLILDRAPNCQERVSWKLIKYLWTFEQRVSSYLPMLHKLYPNTPFYKITKQSELNQLWRSLTQGDI